MLAGAMEQKNKIHPHKFTLWVGIGSILMMFAGLTSAYIIKRNQVNWETFELPVAFWWSTGAILASSITLFLALRSFKERQVHRYRMLLISTLVLGLLFIVLQIVGFANIWAQGITFTGSVSYSFLYTIVGLHALHVLGGIIALIVMLFKAYSAKVRNYSVVPVELINTYWHFVDILWIYLLAFLIFIR
ncbi:MAG: cytochrome c oxidase subunit 3 [Chitinophagaceae bacterium]|nr:cytochrome c oxidase subunit 3 [Bacteroidota bacterium]MCC6258789.1 cytochrome c oxidase subunit 3 [Chitinophagaceae bacterium]MCW5917775.1 cytochrome c oxidase subunit 3 [Ferruginibacter sp.]